MPLSESSSTAECQVLGFSGQVPHQGIPPPPRPAWMWKPRSKLTHSDGKTKHATALLQLRRLGAKHWNRRFVFLDHHFFCYGKDKGRKDKQVPFELIETVRREPAETLQREHAPKEFAIFGWYLAVKGRMLLFCAESEESAEQWVGYLTALLRAMKGSPTGLLARIAPSSAAGVAADIDATPKTRTPMREATLAELGAQYDKAHPHDKTHYDTLTTLTSPGALLTEDTSTLAIGEQPRSTPQPSILGTSGTNQRSKFQNIDGAHAGLSERPQETTLVEQARTSSDNNFRNTNSSVASAALIDHAATQGRQGTANKVADRDAEDHETDVGDQDDGHDNTHARMYSDASALDVSSDDTEGDDSNDGDSANEHEDEFGEQHARTKSTSRPLSRSAMSMNDAPPQDDEVAGRSLPLEVRYAHFLLPLAVNPHSHIGYRIPALESYFKSGDDIGCVTFSRAMEKIGKRDNVQTREVVLTTRHLYLFSKGRLANSQQVRCIDTHDITGVMESTRDKTVVAVLIPTFHDILLKVVAQNSCVPGTPAEVKQQLIAHLYKAHCDVHTDHRFLFRESAAVANEIRRSEDAKYPPLVVHVGDQMRVGEKPALLETFAKNADETVYWSSMVRLVQADRKPRLCALVVTESSIYSLSDTLQEVVRRVFMRDLLHVEYDRDAQSILLQCCGVDVLFNMQSSAEFDDFLRVLPSAVADGFGRTLRLIPSKQLYSHAKLFSFSTLSSAGPAEATRSAMRRHRIFLWPRGKRVTGGTKLLSSFAAAAGENADDDSGAGEAFYRSIRSDYRNSQAIRVFCAQFRFVEELLLDYDDVMALRHRFDAVSRQPCWDTLQLRSTFDTRARVGEICLSAACRLLDAEECATLAKTSARDLHENIVKSMGTPRAVCVTSEGFLFLRSGAASAAASSAAVNDAGATRLVLGSGDSVSTMRSKVNSRLRVAVSHISSSGTSGETCKDDGLILEFVGWSSIAAVVRCHSNEGSSVALLTNRTHSADYLFLLDSAQTMLDVMTAAMGCYAQYRHYDSDHTHFLPLYTAPRAQNLAVALKKTIFDPFPTVALRYTPCSFHSDRLRMAFIPEMADACRRFGDNTIYFSGVAWRVRSATLRKYGGRLDDDPGANMQRQNNHLYKSFIFVLTNVAIYHCTKGGFEVVRRTLLTDIKGVTIGQHDPDTVLLSVPSEYDMYFRVSGRGVEVVTRLQEAYVEWTNYGHYLPHERQGCHTLDDYGLPVRQAACVAALGTLTKPAYFNDLQRSRSAAECRRQTQQWHLRCLRRAIASFERAQAAARKERCPSLSPINNGLVPQWSMWSRIRAALGERQSYLYFVQRRCFRFGLTSENFDEMQRAQQLLRRYSEMEASATALSAAMSSTDPAVFKEALQRASVIPDLRLLVEEGTRFYEGYLARRACLTSVFSAVQCYRYQPHGDSTSLGELEATLLDLVHQARRLGFDSAFLRYVVRAVRVLVQRTQIQRMVCNPANHQRLSVMQDGGWMLVQQAAGEVGMTWRPPSATAPRSPLGKLQLNIHVAQLALKKTAMTGEPALIHGATALALSVLDACKSKMNTGTPATWIKGHEAAVAALRHAVMTVQDTHTQTKEEERQHLARAVEALIAARQAHQRQQTWTPRIVAAMLATCISLEEQVSAQPLPDIQSYGSTQSVLAMEHAMLTEQQHRLQLRHTLATRELKAQQQHEHELRKRRLATQRAAERRQRRETIALEQRRRKALALWGSQVDQLVSKLDAVLANADAEADESIRLGIKRCVHLQRWIAESGARYGLAASTSLPSLFSSPTYGAQRTALPKFFASSKNSLVYTTVAAGKKGERALADPLAELQSVAARAHRLLDMRARGGADPYARPIVNNTNDSITHVGPLFTDGATVAAVTGEGGDVEATPPRALPAEVEQLIASLDAEGLAAYIQSQQLQYDSAGVPALVEQIRMQWRHARRHQRWVEGLHRRLHAAAVLHSRELLEASLQQAEAARYTDAAVVTARRAVAAMTRQHQQSHQQRSKNGEGRPSGTAPPIPSCVPSYFDPWRRPPASSVESAVHFDDDNTDCDAAIAPPVLYASKEEGDGEVPADEAEIVDGTGGKSNSGLPTGDDETKVTGQDSGNNSKLEKVMKAMVGVALAAEAIPAAAPGAMAILQQLHAVTLALVKRAIETAAGSPSDVSLENGGGSASDDEKRTPICITSDNPFCAPFLRAWRTVLQHQVRPNGLLIKTPRSVWDIVRSVGEANIDGAYTAPYVTRLSSDFQRLYRSNSDDDAARLRTDAVLLALVFFSHRMTCVWDGLMKLGEQDRRELLLPDSLMMQPAVVRALHAAAGVCDALRWQFADVQELAMQCMFPRNSQIKVPIPQRFSNCAAVVGAVQDSVGIGLQQQAKPAMRTASPPIKMVQGQLSPLVSFLGPHTPPRSPAVSPSAIGISLMEGPRGGEGNALSLAVTREAASAQALRHLQEAVRHIASYFTWQLRAHSLTPGTSQTSVLYFDEHSYPEVNTLVEASVLPALVMLFSCGLVRRYQLVRTRTLWDVLTALKAALTASSRTLAAAEVLPIMDVVDALTDVAGANGRRSVRLRNLTAEKLDDLRVRVFLRECLSRRQLYPLVCTLFPPLNGNESWVGCSGMLWSLYNPELCLLYPPDAPPSTQLRPLLEKLSALPFVLIPDSELL